MASLSCVSPYVASSWPFPDVYPDECPELPLSTEHDPEDEVYWAQSTGGGMVEGEPDPTDLRLVTMSALDYFSECLEPECPEEWTASMEAML